MGFSCIFIGTECHKTQRSFKFNWEKSSHRVAGRKAVFQRRSPQSLTAETFPRRWTLVGAAGKARYCRAKNQISPARKREGWVPRVRGRQARRVAKGWGLGASGASGPPSRAKRWPELRPCCPQASPLS